MMVRIPLNSTGGRLLDVFCREMDDFVGRMGDIESWTNEKCGFSPRADIVETDKAYEVSMDVPGMEADDFSIELHEGRLTIRGERAQVEEQEGKTFRRIERIRGTFERAFNLGKDVDAENVVAEYNNGVLTITVAKVAKVQPKKIEINK